MVGEERGWWRRTHDTFYETGTTAYTRPRICHLCMAYGASPYGSPSVSAGAAMRFAELMSFAHGNPPERVQYGTGTDLQESSSHDGA